MGNKILVKDTRVYGLCKSALEDLEIRQGVIIDRVINSGRIFKQLIEVLGSYTIYFVHVTCPLGELRKREAMRNNRCLSLLALNFAR